MRVTRDDFKKTKNVYAIEGGGLGPLVPSAPRNRSERLTKEPIGPPPRVQRGPPGQGARKNPRFSGWGTSSRPASGRGSSAPRSTGGRSPRSNGRARKACFRLRERVGPSRRKVPGPRAGGRPGRGRGVVELPEGGAATGPRRVGGSRAQRGDVGAAGAPLIRGPLSGRWRERRGLLLGAARVPWPRARGLTRGDAS